MRLRISAWWISGPTIAVAAMPSPKISPGRRTACCWARSVLCIRAFAFTNHASSCNWKSRWFANRRPGPKVHLHVTLQPLDRALRLRIRRLTEQPVDRQKPAERRIALGRPAAARVKTPLPIPHHQLRQRPQRPHATNHPHNTSGAPLLNTKAPAPPREHPRHATTTQPRQTCP